MRRIIYKHGIEDKIKQNIGLSIEYFEESIRQRNDCVSMYNLAHLYFYEEPIKDSINKSIDLLIRSLKSKAYPPKVLLCLCLIKKFGCDLQNIKAELDKYRNESHDSSSIIYQMIIVLQLNYTFEYEKLYEYYKPVDYLYDHNRKIIPAKSINERTINPNQTINPRIRNITSVFYDGFGIDI